MIVEVLQNSRSLLLRATHVVRVVLLAAQPGGWERVSEAMSRREIALRVRAEEVFKGQDAKAGQALEVRVEQYRNDSPLGKAVPGPWSDLPMESGQAFVVLGAGRSLKEALEAPLQVLAAATAPEVRLVSAAEGEKMLLAAVADKARAIAKDLDFLFADWFWARFGEEALSGADAADSMFSLLEAPALGPTARSGLAGAAVARAASAPLTYGFGVRRLVQALFRLFAVPEAAGMNDNSVSTWLPALIRLKPGPPVAAGVFFDRRERAELKKALAAYRGPSDPGPLAAWLEGR